MKHIVRLISLLCAMFLLAATACAIPENYVVRNGDRSVPKVSITVEGAVNKPGIFPITGKTTLLQAIALAGGVDDKIVDLSGIVVMRQVGGRKQAAVFDLRQVRKGNIEDPQLYGDDVIVVEQSGSKTAFRRFIESVPALGIFAWF